MRVLLLLLILLSAATAVNAQSTEQDLKGRLLKQPLYLSGLWGDDDLDFDSDGKLVGSSDPVSFTLGGIEIIKVQLKHNRLQLLGRRMGLELTDPTPKRAPLLLGTPRFPREEAVHLDIAAPASGDYSSALDAIFAKDITDLVPTMPSWWQPYAHKHFLPGSTSDYPLPTPGPDRPMRIGGSVIPPTMLTAKEADFNLYAKLMKYQGKVLIHLVVDRNGKATRLSIERGIGLGLDERALAAVRDYVFSPATQNGKPVTVEINMEVNFQIY
jgi:TonB family protein